MSFRVLCNASFQVSGSTLQSGKSFDFEAKSSYTICVRTSDSGSPALSFDKQLTIQINDVNDARVAGPDSYSGAIGNTLAVLNTTASGPQVALSGSNLIANDTDQDNHATPPPAPFAHVLSAVAETVTALNNNGTATINSDGSFTFLPKAGLKNTDVSFTYHVSDGTATSAGTATIHIDNTLVWYVNNALASSGDGRSSSPYNTLSPINPAGGAGDADGPGDIIFLYQGSSSYAGGLPLEATQQLIGQPQGLTLNGQRIVAAGGSNPSVTNSAGAAITLANGNTIQRVNATGASGAGVAGSSITTLSYGPNTTISANTGGGVVLSGSASGNLEIAAAITTSAGHSVSIAGRSGGTTTLFGTISDTGAGLTLTGNTGATINLTNTITASTGGNNALTAAGGGTITATGSASTLTTTTGTPLSVTNTTIGASNVNFKSISSTGAPNGIFLNNTGSSGGLAVTGDGSTASSGGTITESTGSASDADTAGKAVYLSNASNVSLKFIKVSVTNGNASGIVATNLGGTNTLEKSLVDFNNTTPPAVPAANAYALRVANTSTDTTITVDGTTFQNKQDGTTAVSYSFMGNSQATVNVRDSSTGDAFESKYTNLFGSGIVMGAGDNSGSTAHIFFNVSDTKFLNAPSNGLTDLEMTAGNNGTLVPNITNNTFDKVALPLAVVGVINVNTAAAGRLGDATHDAVIQGNTITNIRSGPGPTFAYSPTGTNGYYAIRIAVDNTVTGINHKIEVLNNTITEIARVGLYVSSRELANDVNVLVQGNTIGTLANPVGYGNVRGVHLETQASSMLKVQVLSNPSIVTRSSSGSNSSLHLRSGVDNNSTANLQATVVGNTIKNAGTATTNGRFRAQTLGTTEGLTGAAGKLCLDLRNNSLEDSTKLFELIHNSTGTFGLNQSGNTGTLTTSGSGTVTSVASCTLPTL